MMLTRLGIVAACVFGSAAAPSGNQGCCTPGSGSGGAGGGGTGGEGVDECFDYASFDSTTPMVSFKDDVLPIFRASCGLSTACHGAQVGGPPGQPYLGPSIASGTVTTAQIDAIFAQVVGASATKAPLMKLVDPGKADVSFLMHKMDGTLTCPDVVCDAAGCGASMPNNAAKLSQSDRDIVRRWIAQGAMKN